MYLEKELLDGIILSFRLKKITPSVKMGLGLIFFMISYFFGYDQKSGSVYSKYFRLSYAKGTATLTFGQIGLD